MLEDNTRVADEPKLDEKRVVAEEDKRKEELLKQLVERGAHLGFSRTRTHPSARHFVFGFKNRSGIINLEKTLRSLAQAKEFLTRLGAEGGVVFWVGTKAEARQLTKQVAEKLSHPYVTSRWLGGTLTNWEQMKSRINLLKELKEKREKGEFAAYTKRERLGFDEEIEKLEEGFATIASLEKLPQALVVVDTGEEEIAVNEAVNKKIPIIGLTGSDSDLQKIDYPVVINDTSMGSLEFFLNELANAYQLGQSQIKPEEKNVGEN